MNLKTIGLNIWNKGVELVKRGVDAVVDNSKALVAGGAALLGFKAATAPAQAALVTYTEATGAVAFDPSSVVTPVVTAVVAAIGVGAALFVIAVGIRWVYKMVKGSK